MNNTGVLESVDKGEDMPELSQAPYYDDLQPNLSIGSVNINDLLSEKGTNFEINEDDWDIGEDPLDELKEPEEVTETLRSAMGVGEEDEGQGEGDEELTPFQRLAPTMNDVTPDSSRKVMKKVLKPGIGPVVPAGALVRVFYSGRLEYSDEPFDSSYLQHKNRPRAFKLGDGTWLAGLDLAVSTMKKDEISMFLIHPDFYMGALGCPPRIPPNATVLFRIELVGFSDRSGLHEYFSLPMSERKGASMDTILQVVRIEKDDGKKCFKEKRYRSALNKYRKAINILEECHLADAAAEARQQEELIVLLRNAAACANKLGEAGKTIGFASRAIRINPKDVKAWFLKGKGLAQQSEFEEAKNALLKAKKIDPNCTDITVALEDLNRKFKQFSMTEKENCKRMFKNVNATPKDEPAKQNQKYIVNEVDPLEDVSEEFREHATKHLQLFKESSDVDALPFPKSQHTIGEITCLVSVAEELGLNIQEVGTGSNLHYRFSKS